MLFHQKKVLAALVEAVLAAAATVLVELAAKAMFDRYGVEY